MLHETAHEVTKVLQAVKICATIADSTYALEMNSDMCVYIYIYIYIYIYRGLG